MPGWTGNVSPSPRPSFGDHAPSAMTTSRAWRSPCSVATLTRPFPARRPSMAQFSTTVPPSSRTRRSNSATSRSGRSRASAGLCRQPATPGSSAGSNDSLAAPSSSRTLRPSERNKGRFRRAASSLAGSRYTYRVPLDSNSQSSASSRTRSSSSFLDRSNSGTRWSMMRRKSRSLQRPAKRSSQRMRSASRVGRTSRGASAVSIHFSACRTCPGAASGRWLGVMVPQLPCELPLPTVCCSRIVTPRPALSR